MSFQTFCFFFRNSFFNSYWSSFNHGFGFFQAQAGCAANSFNSTNFVSASAGQHYVKFGLLFSSSSFAATSYNCSSSRYAELFFHSFDQLNNVHYGHFSYGFDDLVFSDRHY
ncbi:hypothetical protein SAMN04488540_1317 [Ferrimonas sediminum]|uniref:Uncharacterized protein n=1 Tax=Ferrimonas sediminum TaxID=718193 RepID=A0A1G9BLF5_9GAMM|nr:hypothetical protein SAMN04488540_1317 [Ferrimonas sediminum]